MLTMNAIIPSEGAGAASAIQAGNLLPTSTSPPAAVVAIQNLDDQLPELKVKADFVKFMEDEWKKRVEMVEALQQLESKIRLNRFQCKKIISIYSALKFLSLHPEDYLYMLDDQGSTENPISFQTADFITKAKDRTCSILKPYFSSLRASFLELSRIMRHGKLLVEECACEDWIRGAVLKTTTIPKNEWSIVTPFCLHVQKLEWIMDVIGRSFRELWSIEEFRSFTFSNSEFLDPSDIGLADHDITNILKSFSWTDVEIEDRRLLLDDLSNYLKEPSLNDQDSQEKLQLANFVVWKLQNEAPTVPLANLRSSVSPDVPLSFISEDPQPSESPDVPLSSISNDAQASENSDVPLSSISKDAQASESPDVPLSSISKDAQASENSDVPLSSISKDAQASESPDVPLSSISKDAQASESPDVPLSSISKDAQASENSDVPLRSISEDSQPLGENPDVSLSSIYEAERFARNQMDVVKYLGGGSQCIAVYKKRWLGIEVAVKELKKEYKENFDKEIYFAELQHPHVVRVFDHWVGERPNIVMELMDKDLTSFMETKFKDGHPSLPWAIDLIHQLAEAMKYLWDNNISHRDLKSLNLLVCQCQCKDEGCLELGCSEGCVIVKLADFGTSKFSTSGMDFTTIAGSTPWMAPEVFEGGGYTIAADIYSFAITCSEILTGKLPFLDIDRKKTAPPSTFKRNVKAGLRPTLPKDCPIILSAYLQKCWATNPEERPKHFSEICDFLLYCKEVMLIRNEMPSPLQTINDAKFLLTHLGIKWCLERDEEGNLTHIPSALYTCIEDAILYGTNRKELVKDVPETELWEAQRIIRRLSDKEASNERQLFRKSTTTDGSPLTPSDVKIIWELPPKKLVAGAMAGLLSMYNEEGKIRFIATCGRLLVLFFLISRNGLPALLQYRPTFPLLGLKDFMFYSLVFIAFVLVVYSKVSELLRKQLK